VAAHKSVKRKGHAPLEERFEFQGDGSGISEGTTLRSALFSVVERCTGAERGLRVWRKTGTSADRDLRQLWEHERRQVQRLMSTEGAADLIVNVLEFVEDDDEFGVVLEEAGLPLKRLREKADRYHWIAQLEVVANRIVLWRNIARVAQAVGLLHSHGMVHGAILPDVIMTRGDRVADFKLSGFEWSLWFAAPVAGVGHAGVSSRERRPSAACSFSTDWVCLGRIAADLLRLVIEQNGIPAPRPDSIELLPSEQALVRRLLLPARTEPLDGASIAGAIGEIVTELERVGAMRTGVFLLVVPDTSGLGDAVSRATRGDVEPDDHAACITWAQADLSGGSTLVVPAVGVTDRPAYLLTQALRYDLRPSRPHGEEPTWHVGYCPTAQLRDEAVAPPWPVESRALTQPIELVGIPRAGRERRDRLGPAALSWETLLRPEQPAALDPRSDVRHALVLVQVVEAVGRSLETLPVEILDVGRTSRGQRLILRAKPDNDRDVIARGLNLADTAETLRRVLTEEQRQGEEGWAVSNSQSFGSSRVTDDHATFVREVIHRGVLGYEFETDGEPDRGRPLFLRSRKESASQQVISRRLRVIHALAELPGVSDFLAEPWSVRRSIVGDLVEDAAFKALDDAKQDALRRFSISSPAHFVVGPPGVGKTRLATEVVRRRLAAEGSTRLFLTAQGHDALDNLQAAVRKAAEGLPAVSPIIVRAASEARPRKADDSNQHVFNILSGLASSPAIARLPPPFRARVAELAGAARNVADGGSAEKARAGLWATADLVMDAADVVLATTNSAVVERLVAERANFDTVIVEEAAKATGPELVGPLMLSGRRLLIGDHNQLPPFDAALLEGVLNNHNLTQSVLRDAERVAGSLFPAGELEGLQEVARSEPRMERVRGLAFRLVQFFKTVAVNDDARAGNTSRRLTSVLDEQRRMHPALAEVVSKAFYNGRLRTHHERETEAYRDPAPFACSGPLPESPLVIADFRHVMLTGRERPMEGEGRRWTNSDEANAVLAVLSHVKATSNAKPPSLAILSPYAAQVELLARRVETAKRSGELRALKDFVPARSDLGFVGTVDSFQGAEADLVIVSLVRNNPKVGFGALGFLRDPRRMNVLLSRAKSKLVLVTSLRFLSEAVRSLLHNRLRERRNDVLWCASVLTALAKHDSIVALPRHGPSDGAPFS